jgi:hypothetical protein
MKSDEFPKYLVIVMLIFALSFIVIKTPYIYSYSHGANYENVTVDTKVNITSSKPVITNIEIQQGNATITLNAGMTREIICNVTVQDYNGWDDVTAVNATFFDGNSVTMADPDNENNHYTNTSCILNGNNGQYESYWECGFDVWYYANNGSNWICNATAIDAYYPTNNNFSHSNHNITTIDPLYAINVTSLIDYGPMSVGDTSPESETANITNFGNMPVNVSLFGWGGNNVSDPKGEGLAFICEMGNISIENERYSVIDEFWLSMDSLSENPVMLPGLTIPKRTAGEVINTTYWRLYVPPNPFGECNGTIVFAAEVS